MKHRVITILAIVAMLVIIVGMAAPQIVTASATQHKITTGKRIISTGEPTVQYPCTTTACRIYGVPEIQQITGSGCGAAALEMVMAYYGPIISQMQIYDAARTYGTSILDMVAAGQFSNLSTTVGTAYPASEGKGYSARSLGYAAFYYASKTPWLSQLESLIYEGYPVIVLVHWMPTNLTVNGAPCPTRNGTCTGKGNIAGDFEYHYRVVVGYDKKAGVIMFNDPWGRMLNKYYRPSDGTYNMSIGDFLQTWSASTASWGVPGLAYGGVLVTPWQVAISAPASVTVGKTFAVTATITYPAPAPFNTIPNDGVFPDFRASGFGVTLSVGSGLTVVGSATLHPASTLLAGATVTATWEVVAVSTSGTHTLKATAYGYVLGSIPYNWGPNGIWPAYSYRDRIGGTALQKVSIT